MNNNGFVKVMLFALLAIYIISPVDLAPGPIDDLLLVLLSVALNTRKSGKRELPTGQRED
ncbi:MAG: hypothetical protein II969_01025 [Anaerolineaceae bacterium]|nr:hypothetical protein [Anaerolineaceae bacterium]